MKWIDAIVKVLQNNKQDNGVYAPMHYSDITDAIIQQNLRETYGITPKNTANAYMSTRPDLFNSLGGGFYGLTQAGINYEVDNKNKSRDNKEVDAEDAQINSKINQEIEKANESKIIKIFGMFWDRTKIEWRRGKMKGRQNVGSEVVDFKDVRGLYVLYDGREVIYVGQALKTPILKRLKDHTKDRLSGRWNRFSWFSIDGINPDGTIFKVDKRISMDLEHLIDALEGIMIEGLEAPQNRRQGNNFGDEYIQDDNIEMEKEQILKTCVGLLSRN